MAAVASKQIGSQRFLSLLLSYLDTSQTYTADAGRWADAIRWLRDQYDDRYPGLFADFDFATRPGALSYSRQVSEFLTRVATGNIVEVMNPGYARMHIRKAAQENLREEQVKRADAEIIEAIRFLAGELLKNQRDKLVLEK